MDAGLSGAHIGRTDFPEANQITSHANCTLEHLKTLMKNPELDHICVVGDHEMDCCHAQAGVMQISDLSLLRKWGINY